MIVSLVGQKGGSGKSTIATCIATELMIRNRSVLLVDCDPQRTVVTWHDVASEAQHATPSVVSMTGTLHRDNQLPKISKGYTDVIIDTPPRLGEVQRSALMVSDLAILPCGPSGPDAWALAESIQTIKEAMEYRPNLYAAIVINKKRSRTNLGKGARDALESTHIPVLRSELGFRQAFQDAITAGMGVAQYAPKDASCTEIRALVDELIALEKKK